MSLYMNHRVQRSDTAESDFGNNLNKYYKKYYKNILVILLNFIPMKNEEQYYILIEII